MSRFDNDERRVRKELGGRHRGPRKDNDLGVARRDLYNPKKKTQLRFEPHAPPTTQLLYETGNSVSPTRRLCSSVDVTNSWKSDIKRMTGDNGR